MRTKPRLSGRNWQIEAMKPGNGCSAAPDVVGAEDDEVHLHVGRRHVRAGAEEAAGIAGADREQPFR